MQLSGAHIMKKQNYFNVTVIVFVYIHFVSLIQELLREEDNKWCGDIDKDLDRTFPEHERFCIDELCQQKSNG